MANEWLELYPKSYDINADLTGDDHLSVKMAEACSAYGDRDFAECMGSSMTYAEFEQASTQLGAWLQTSAEVKEGERVAVMLPNTHQFLISFYGIQKIGGISVHTNPLYTAREMKHQFCDSGAKVLIILDLFMDKLESIIRETDIETVIVTSIADKLSPLKSVLVKSVLKLKGKVPAHSLKPFKFNDVIRLGSGQNLTPHRRGIDDTCILQYTGGTTGVAKGAELSSRNIIANSSQIIEALKECSDEMGSHPTALTALPLYHIFALSVNFLTLQRLGYKLILVPQPVPIINTVKAIRKYKPDLMTGVNTLFNALNNSRDFQELEPNFIKVAIAGGMALQESVTKEWQKLTGRQILQGFGLTEASPVTHVVPISVKGPLGTIGLPLIGTDAKVVDEDGQDVPNGDAGELWVRGPQVMKGYWKKKEESIGVLEDGWLKTGDIAKRDDQGWFFIVDRKKDMILVSGFNVYPNEVEEVLASHPKVLEAAVVGTDDGKGGEKVKAFVVKKEDDLSEDEILSFCRENLTGYKRPREVEFREGLPKSNVGKILRKELRAS